VSYCRKGDDSDVYLYRCIGPNGPEYVLPGDELPQHLTALRCHECLLMPALTDADREWDREHYTTASGSEMLAHLERHQSLGHRVPAAAFARLRIEQ
jgi:hypothetical protein